MSGTPDLRKVLAVDPAITTARIVEALRHQVHKRLHRKGVVLGLSGGVDSSVCAALAVQAFGPGAVLGIFMPEAHSESDSERLGRVVAAHLGVPSLLENITPALEGLGCYARQEAAIQRLVPGYGPGWKSKIVLPSVLESDTFRIFSLVVRSPEGVEERLRLTPQAYLELVAATNLKQRVRKTIEYLHADRLAYAVLGTPNRLEYDQGFFVKQGDGAADVKPIAHLYKTQVYALAGHLGLPEEIRHRLPTTDTYSLPQTQEEFYFSLPYGLMDLCLLGFNLGLAPEAVAEQTGLGTEEVGRVFRDITSKRRGTRYLHEGPLLVEEVEGITSGGA